MLTDVRDNGMVTYRAEELAQSGRMLTIFALYVLISPPERPPLPHPTPPHRPPYRPCPTPPRLTAP